MRDNFAPECNDTNCTRTTWSPSGFCPHHDHANKVNLQSPGRLEQSIAPATVSGTKSSSEKAAKVTMKRVFPDISEDFGTDAVRDQVNLTIQSAVSIDVYRKFPNIDVADKAARENALRQYRNELVEACRISPVEYTDESAEILSRSSTDLFGRSLDDSVDLASYGIMKEYQIARLTGKTQDSNGVSYRMNYEDYCDRVNDHISHIVGEEFDNQLSSYSDIVKEVTGKDAHADYRSDGAQSSAPTQRIDQGGYGQTQTIDAPVSHQTREYSQPTEAAPQNPSSEESTKEVLSDIGKSALGFGVKAFKAGSEHRKNMNNSKQARRQSREAQNDERRDRDIKRMQHDALNKDRGFWSKKPW